MVDRMDKRKPVKLTRSEKKAMRRTEKLAVKLEKEQERADKIRRKKEAKRAAREEKRRKKGSRKSGAQRKDRKPTLNKRTERKHSYSEKKSSTGKVRCTNVKRKQERNISAQNSIPYREMAKDGICRVQEKYYSKTIRFYDINYQLAQNEDKNAIFENWCDFLNYFDSTIHFQISFINHHSNMKEFESVVNKYTAEGRKEIHKQLETVDIERVHELMRNPISNETVEFNDNCVSLFVAQRGKCAICKLPLTLENMRCVRKIPKSCGGDDKYNNLIIVHKEMERLIKSQDNKEIKRILNKYKLESNQRRKVNTIRKNAGLEEIDVKALDKEL